MSEKDNGGPAFPVQEAFDERRGEVTRYASDGMTMRDYFAAKAMQAIGNAAVNDCIDIAQAAEAVAKQSYFMADAMLRARE